VIDALEPQVHMNYTWLLRLYLLGGLIFHKVLWEYLKRRHGRLQSGEAESGPASGIGAPSGRVGEPSRSTVLVHLIKRVKLVILAGILAQTVLPQVLPITNDCCVLRWVGAVVYSIGLAGAILGRIQIGDSWSDIEAVRVTQNHVLVANGLYRFIRHPIYTGDLLLLLGLEISLNSWLALGVVALTAIVVRQATREEQLLLGSLPGYDLYCRRTRRFIPFVI
jgi:protein-S-isoprenylcysteine O-methyltransferase Ste14